jgi:protein-S-isoprenylcysteine O-methyltransferase Ste14
MSNTIRHLIGYIIGLSIFIVLIPYGLYKLSELDPFINAGLTEYLCLRLIISLPFCLIGLFYAIWSNIFLLDIGKGGPTDGFNVAISPRTKNLVVTGPYRYSRNPMVFGALTLYFSISLFLLSLLSLITLIVFIWFVIQYLKRTEEKRLLKDFGEAYSAYKSITSMIFPFFTQNQIKQKQHK